jgi:integrase
VPFNPEGRLAAVLKRRAALGPDAFVFGSETGSYQPNIQTPWETLKLLAYGHEPEPNRKGAAWNREQFQRIDLRWHDLCHEGACRLLADGVDIRIIQLMLGHAGIQQAQRYLNVTDEELDVTTASLANPTLLRVPTSGDWAAAISLTGKCGIPVPAHSGATR